jgi:SAM-dependent methyltransferase
MIVNTNLRFDARIDTASRAYCRVCGSLLTIPFANLGVSPIANNMVTADVANLGPEPFYPLNAMTCGTCWLVQLTYSHPADKLFTDEYPYFSSYSQSWLAHSSEYSAQMIKWLKLGKGHRVVEVASNDGYLLRNFKDCGCDVIGVEPCGNVAAVAREQHGIPTISEFFGRAVGARIAEENGYANLIVANNVLAHVPDTIDFLGGFSELLASDGVITFEFPHLLELIFHNQFDTIYHEHYCYLSLLSVRYALARVGLRVFDAQRLRTHGGSLRLFVCHETASYEPTAELAKLELQESEAGLDRSETYFAFQERVRSTKRSLLRFLIDAKESGKRIVGYGAPAKGNTLLNFCGVGIDFIDFTVDISPHKQGHFLPGSRLPVLSPEAIREAKPDYLLVLPWNISDEIMRQHAYASDWGGRFVIPIPDIQIL